MIVVAACAAAVALLAIGLLGAARRLLAVVTVQGSSMHPTYAPGQRLLMLRTPPARPTVGRVVVLRNPLILEREGAEPDYVIKRLAAGPGDPVPEAVLEAVHACDGDRVPAGHLVVLGDGAVSTDSRHWGYLQAGALSGVVLARLSRPPSPRALV